MDPTAASDPELWRLFLTAFGPAGFALLMTNAAAFWYIRELNNRLKEKDKECREEMANMMASFEVSRSQLRADIKEAFQSVGKLAEQVTVLATKASFKV